MNFNRINRSTHKWASIVIALPFLIILISGILLLLKKDVEYIQPASAKGSVKNQPSISFEQVLIIAKSVPKANIDSWRAIDRLDVRPGKGIIKIRAKSEWEIQIDATTGEILKTAYRRSDFIEQLHDFTYWQDSANLWFTLPLSIVLLLISITGIILFFLPYYKRYKNRQRIKDYN
ncbi:PepSY domain-containing protein [Cognaticolwellia mytili]|uniref:PepSY domain-containing protein n=1 Tax=Cognaticolwellia mytili TaxID=1888913 RepID=UPI000A177998|nr:PepSY domain-containing protein [Cognaticolwellia mytili]